MSYASGPRRIALGQVSGRDGGSEVTIALLRCDGGEEVDRFTSTDPVLLRFVAARGGRSG